MACCGGKAESEDERKARELEQLMRQERLEDLFKFKVLLLGAGETGKSTIVKQIRKACGGTQPTAKELDRIALSLHNNVIDCMSVLLYQAETFEYDLEADDLKTKEMVKNYVDSKRIDVDFMDKISRLWESDAIRRTFARRAEYWILDSASYYFKNLEKFVDDNWVPDQEDQLYARVRTTGLVSYEVEARNDFWTPNCGDPENIKYKIIDVGGQRSERKKWIHQFDDVKCILFITSLAEYCQVCSEEPTKNRMDESMELLKNISKKKIFLQTPMYVILNKKDLFSEVYKGFPLSAHFPDYKGQSDTEGIDFIREKYISTFPKNRQDKYRDTTKPMVFPMTGIVKAEVADAFSTIRKQLLVGNKDTIEKTKKEIAAQQAAEAKSNGCSIL
jgi:GTPase SAR1 family protein